MKLIDKLRSYAQNEEMGPSGGYTEAGHLLLSAAYEIERLVGEVVDRNQRAVDGDKAVKSMENLHNYYEGLEAKAKQMRKELEKAAEKRCYMPDRWLDSGCGQCASCIARDAINEDQ